MTAILSYFNECEQVAYIICDNIGTSKESEKITDKCFELYNRFYIAPWGPNILPSAIQILRDLDAYDNLTKPSNVDDLVSMLYSIYKERLKSYKAETSSEYQNEEKTQGAVIYDYEVHQMFSIDLGQPFKGEPTVNSPSPKKLLDGFHKFSLFDHAKTFTTEEKDFLNDPLEYSKKVFKELDANIKNSQNQNVKNSSVGTVGTYFKRINRFREFKSAFASFLNYIDYFSQ